MGRTVAARAGRRAALTMALVGAVGCLGAAQVSALPNLGGLLHAPVAGLHVDLGCANPANHRLVGRVLAAATTTAAGPLRCFSTAIASSQGAGPQIMAGPTRLGPQQIQSAYKLTGGSCGGS